MKPFTVHKGRLVALMNDGINTDQLMPSRYLSHIEKKGFGKFLFANWRYLDDEESVPNPDFPLNYPEHQGASILVAGDNFAGGSSREHAVWGLMDYGFRVVIAGNYNDIFYNNSLQNGLLAITLPKEERVALSELPPETEITVNLETQTIETPEATYHFDINQENRHKLLHGIDDITQTLEYDGVISAYEHKWNDFYQPQDRAEMQA